MKNSLVLFNQDMTILIKDKYIKEKGSGYDNNLINQASNKIDISGIEVRPGWVDSHLHMPGKLLYEIYGVDLQNIIDFNECLRVIRKESEGKKWLRGFGWSAEIFKGDKLKEVIEYINKLESYVVLFSDDYHSCIINNKIANKLNINKNIIKESEIFKLLSVLEELSFSEEEIESAILEYQDRLLRYGITCIQTLMFLGGNGDKEYKVLHKIDKERKLKLKVNIALTVQGYDDLSLIEDRYIKLKQYESEHIKLNTIKIYTDGVLENYTAYLSDNYKNKASRGYTSWNEEILNEFCKDIDKKGRQIHIHAIGDMGVKLGVRALKYAMDTNKSIGKNRHVITHIQLADKEDIELIKEYKIIANIQPYWFGQSKEERMISEMYIGDRIDREYPSRSLRGTIIACSSDSPVTEINNPLIGIRMGANRYYEGERLEIGELVDGFTTNGAYQLFRENEISKIDVGYKADILGYIGNELKFVITDGEIVYVKSIGEGND